MIYRKNDVISPRFLRHFGAKTSYPPAFYVILAGNLRIPGSCPDSFGKSVLGKFFFPTLPNWKI